MYRPDRMGEWVWAPAPPVVSIPGRVKYMIFLNVYWQLPLNCQTMINESVSRGKIIFSHQTLFLQLQTVYCATTHSEYTFSHRSLTISQQIMSCCHCQHRWTTKRKASCQCHVFPEGVCVHGRACCRTITSFYCQKSMPFLI